MILADTSTSTLNNKQDVDNTNSKNKSTWTDEQITFINHARNYCVCIVDVVDSTKTTCEIIESEKIRQYYSVFLNTMAFIIKRHNGRTIKNSGDSLLYYFSRTFDGNNEGAFEDVINCGLTMINENKMLNEFYNGIGLPSISYRISANYGRVELAVSLNSNNADLFGLPVNQCSKINHMAHPNQMIIHNDLHEVLKRASFYNRYIFRDLSADCNEKKSLVYSVDRLEAQDIDDAKLIKANRKQLQNKFSTIDMQNQNNSTSFNILLVDDDKDILFTFKAIFQKEGYNVESFSNPLEALHHYSSKDPYFYDLIITDIRMPELNGIKLYSKIKILNPDAKVFFLSALNALDEVLSIFPEIKYSEVIRKPVEPEILLSKVESILHS
ncbi:MAG: response regulator [Candidatus Nitrosocosmicus sp.]|nr:response regulator [Candidatus Nitrosocosmicus sp.]MDN5867957.1 response regulator [Candidatus Nitrosocosmicus sp.]